jgi:hypothetical protein
METTEAGGQSFVKSSFQNDPNSMIVSSLKTSCYVTPKTKKEADDLEYNDCARHSIKKSISP